jgi:uncharacterized protein
MAVPAGVEERLRQALDQVPGLVSAYVFGSVAAGREHQESDLDIGIVLEHSIYPTPARRFDARLRLLTRLQSAIGGEVDLVIVNDAPPHLARHILWEGVAVVIRDSEANHAARRLALLQAADLEPYLQRMRALKLQALVR